MKWPGLAVASLSMLSTVSIACESPTDPAQEHVVVLHGLGRSAASMFFMAKGLERAGYDVCNIDYTSSAASIEELAANEVLPAIERCWTLRPERIHFVTHSLGGIVVRQLVADGSLPHIGRVVMLGPPNQGSELADTLVAWEIPETLHPPAARQLTTGGDSLPRRLGPPPFEVGVIAGDRSVNPLLSRLIPGPDDGKVSVTAAKLEGMQDFLLLHTTHTFMMNRREVIARTICFLRSGAFRSVTPANAGVHLNSRHGLPLSRE
ncbi:pimeloyl-ACP methyl ester carboxylesterase [Povalibacter uvarum]|uniref:Pimeloyl-ACP methyl ester carboxylesterase n=1 Tax=Povalibacter uvarum TaxID=732238 RepID=A0A841HR67_9GAMM|nr:alpha/beta fold hydrolase [Povalibacter uvarum]MBB6095386.1 pimeloyl-ACP methyl ester carboxylesterase [Povalibacter uvarum]